MNKKDFDPHNLHQKIKNYYNYTYDNSERKPIFGELPEETVKVELRPKEDMARALFKPDPLIPGGYIAHPVTIRAVRKDIFLAGEDFIELEILYTCWSCKKELDLQFWHFCPYCEASFPKNIEIIGNKAHY
ncbi:MAG: hypothetical protein OEY33_01120 [Bdellovibrionales bacterium]|nr:hypothetical protein [Bdellovibrionales bacterium]